MTNVKIAAHESSTSLVNTPKQDKDNDKKMRRSAGKLTGTTRWQQYHGITQFITDMAPPLLKL